MQIGDPEKSDSETASGWMWSLATDNIVYKETILEPVEGVGHFEPLRHYAEVHLLPGTGGAGQRPEL